MDVIKEDQFLDCSGMLCPMPVVKTKMAIDSLETGQILLHALAHFEQRVAVVAGEVKNLAEQ